MKVGVVVDNELNSDIRVMRETGILKEQGFEIFVLCYGFRKQYEVALSGISISRIIISRKLRDLLFFLMNTIPLYEWIWARNIKNLIIRNNIEVLHVHDLYMARAAHTAIKKSGQNVQLILDLHENYPFTITTYNWTKGFIREFISRPYAWQRKERKYLGYANRIIVLSADYRDLLIGRYPGFTKENFVVLPNVPDLSQYKQKSDKPVKSPFKRQSVIIFYYGVIAERRGLFDALEVFTKLVKENNNLNFLLIGPVDKKDKNHFLNLIHQDSIEDHVHYIPWISSTELPAYLELIDICLAPFHKNPQHESGVANKIYEYMLGGKPLIVSDCLPQQKLVEKTNCGLVFTNMEELQAAIIRLSQDSDLRVTLGKNGYEAVMREYNTGMVSETLLKLYESISNN
jgi:glycosyltransferase involved in cell wall biosynthesis